MDKKSEIIETLAKLDVARRQLKESIILFFHEHDPIAIHTLAAAAHQILDDLARQKGVVSIRCNPLIRKGKEKFWKDKINAAQNFFKHADRDPGATFEFRPALSCFFLMDAIRLCNEFNLELPFPEGFLYILWFSKKYEKERIMEKTPTPAGQIYETVLRLFSEAGFDPDNFELMRLLLSGFQTLSYRRVHNEISQNGRKVQLESTTSA